jgi:DNA-directed RNA polymerase specialized sigma24 family protein
MGLDGPEATAVAAPASVGLPVDEVDWESLDAALTALKREDERRYQVVMLRYFAGLPEREAAQCLGVSEPTVRRDWRTARLFLLAHMTAAAGGGAEGTA